MTRKSQPTHILSAKPSEVSAGVVLGYQRNNSNWCFLVGRDKHNRWSIPKGRFDPRLDQDDLLKCALRETYEETKLQLDRNGTIDYVMFPLGFVTYQNGKIVHGFGCWLHTCSNTTDALLVVGTPDYTVSNEFVELDWFTLVQAQKKLIKRQFPLLENFILYTPTLNVNIDSPRPA